METKFLVQNESTESSEFAYSQKQSGAGYNNLSDLSHTFEYQLDNFVGTIKLQGTLDLYPGEDEWTDITETVLTNDSTVLSTNITGSFTGKYAYIRSAHQITQGTIQTIRYSF